MVEIKNFVYCMNVNAVDGKTDIVGVMAAMTPEYIPGLFSFSVSFSLLGLEEGIHKLALKFKSDQAGEVLNTGDMEVNYQKDKTTNLPDEHIGLNVAIGLQNVNFKSEGLYYSEIWLDGTNIGKFEIYAKGQNEKG